MFHLCSIKTERSLASPLEPINAAPKVVPGNFTISVKPESYSLSHPESGAGRRHSYFRLELDNPLKKHESNEGFQGIQSSSKLQSKQIQILIETKVRACGYFHGSSRFLIQAIEKQAVKEE